MSRLNFVITQHRKIRPEVSPGLWHYESCLVMKTGNREGRGFLIHPHMNIRIYHECEGGIEKSVQRITFDHLLASPGLLSDDKR